MLISQSPEMTKVSLKDTFNLGESTRELTSEGYLKATGVLTKVGVQSYRLSEFTGKDSDYDNIVGVFRPSNVVFDKITIDSAKLKPVTLSHPSKDVDTSNYKNLSVGTLGETVVALDDERLSASMLITDTSVVKAVLDDEIKQISVGYSTDVREEIGVHDGQSYQLVFDSPMIINHCALMDKGSKGRGGEAVSILDKKTTEEYIMTKDELKNLLINDDEIKGIIKGSVQDEEGEKVGDEDASKADEDHASGSDEISTDDDSEKTVDTEKEESKVEDKAIEDKAIENLVADRVKLINSASKILKDQSFDSLNDRQILEKVVSDVEGLQDKSDDYLRGIMDERLKRKSDVDNQFKVINDSNTAMVGQMVYSASEIKKL